MKEKNEKINFVERMYEILGDSEEYTTVMPDFIKDVFERIIEKAKVKEDDIYREPLIRVKKDELDNIFVEYKSRFGHTLCVLIDDDDKDYGYEVSGIRIVESDLNDEIEELYNLLAETKYEGFMEKGRRTIQEGGIAIQKGSETILQNEPEGEKQVEQGLEIAKKGERIRKETYGQFEKHKKSGITGKQILDKILNHYQDSLGRYIECEFAKKEGHEGPRGPKFPRIPREHREDYDERIERIIAITGDRNYKIVGNERKESQKLKESDQYYAFFYSLENNNNGESGYMLILEPYGDIDKNQRGGKVAYLSEQDYEEIKARLEYEKQEEYLIEIGIQAIKERFISLVLAGKRQDKTKPVNHKGAFEGYLNRLEFYLKGKSEKLTYLEQYPLRKRRDAILKETER